MDKMKVNTWTGYFLSSLLDDAMLFLKCFFFFRYWSIATILIFAADYIRH